LQTNQAKASITGFMTMKITLLLSKFLLLASASLMMPRRADAQAGSFVAPIPEPNRIYYMPAEDEEHEGTWLTWPHNYGWDSKHVQRYETMYVAIAKALHTGEKVHIVVYDSTEKDRV
jgi:Porphyromonas-type peptidyl-arginine deiminase